MMDSSFESKPLGEICEVIAGQSPPSSTYNLEGRGLPFFQGKADFGKLYPTTRVWCHEPIKIAQPNDILISVRAPVGPTNLCHTEACIGRGLSAIRPKNNADFRYVLYYLRSVERQLATQGRGSTFSAITQSEIRDLRIPLPPLPIQKQIAAILEKADAAREKRRKANQLTEQFLQSAFLEMFGDPVSNPKGWEKRTIEDVATSHDSMRVPIEASIREGRAGSYPYYGASGIIDYIDDFIFDFETVLIGEDGANLLARSSPIAFKVKGKYWVNNHAHVLVPKATTAHDYLVYFFNLIDLAPYISGSAQPKLTAANLSRIPIPVPPIDEQKKFSSLVEKVDSLHAKQKESEEELEELFQSLMQKAFKGELVKEHPGAPKILALHPTDRHAAILGKIIKAHESNPKHLPTLGHVKGEKISHLIEYHVGIDLGRAPVRDAAGPVDYRHLLKVEHRAAAKKWFFTKDRTGAFGKEYRSGKNLQYHFNALSTELDETGEREINRIIDLFLPADTEQAEIAATVYAAWNDLLLEGKHPSDAEVVKEARENWTVEKLMIEEKRFFKCIEWLRSVEIIPKGTGKHTKRKSSRPI